MNEIDIPKGWEKVKLGDLLEEYCERNDNQKYKVVAVGKYGIRKREDIYTKELSKDTSKNKIIMKDTLTIGMGSEQIDIGILIEDEKYCVSPAYTTYKIKNCNSKFLEYYMEYLNPKLSDLFMIVSARQGKSVDKEGLLNYSIKIPNIKEQDKITQILEDADGIITNIDNEITLIDLQTQNYLKTLLDNENMQKVKWTKLKELTKIITKGTTAKRFTNDGIRFIKIEALNGIHVVNEKCSYISKEEHNGYLKRSILQENDILFAIAGATIGKCAIVKKENLPANTNQALAIIRLNENISAEYVLKVLKSNVMKKYISLNLTAGAQPNLNLEQLGNFKIPILDEIEVDKFLKVFNAYERKIDLLSNKKYEFVKLKKSLMQKLLTGKIRVKI